MKTIDYDNYLKFNMINPYHTHYDIWILMPLVRNHFPTNLSNILREIKL